MLHHRRVLLFVLSISCFYTRKKYTGKGIARELIKAVIEYAEKTVSLF